MKFLMKGKVVGIKDGDFGVVSDIQGDNVLVDFGNTEDWVNVEKIDKKYTALLRTRVALDDLNSYLMKVFGQGGEGPEKRIILPTTPTAPFIERLPPAPPGFPEELKEYKPVVDVTKLKEVSKRVADLLQEIKRVANEHAKLQQEIKTIESQVKPLRQAAKEKMVEIYKIAEDVIKAVENNIKGTDELKYMIALWQDRVVYILRWLSTIKDEPSDAEKLEMLWKILESELTKDKIEKIKAKLEKAVKKASDVATELDTYLAILPLTAFKIEGFEIQGQIFKSVIEFGRKLFEVIKRAIRTLFGIRSEVESVSGDIESIVASLEKIGV